MLLLAAFVPGWPEEPEAILRPPLRRRPAGTSTQRSGITGSILKLRPSDTLARSNLGVALARIGHYEDAIAEYHEAMKAGNAVPVLH